MLQSKLTNIIIFIIAIGISAGSSIYYLRHNGPNLDCTTDVDLHIVNEDKKYVLTGIVHMVFHLVKGSESYISEYGTVIYNSNRYIIDRNIRLKFSNDTKNGYYEVDRGAVDKNPKDTLPEDVYWILTSKQKKLFFQLVSLGDELWQIKDLRRTLVICKKK